MTAFCVTVLGRPRDEYQWGSVAVQAAGGVEVALSRRLAAVGEYKLSRVRESLQIAGGGARLTVVTHHVVGGLTARF